MDVEQTIEICQKRQKYPSCPHERIQVFRVNVMEIMQILWSHLEEMVGSVRRIMIPPFINSSDNSVEKMM